MDAWDNFFLAQAGASAALTGLLFVSVSINLEKILKVPKLPNRAFQAITIFLQILVVSSLGLVPGQSLRSFGIIVLALGIVIWVFITLIDIKGVRLTDRLYRHVAFFNAALTQISSLPYIGAGIFLIARNEVGLDYLVAAILLSYAKAIFDAWVLLVEINR